MYHPGTKPGADDGRLMVGGWLSPKKLAADDVRLMGCRVLHGACPNSIPRARTRPCQRIIMEVFESRDSYH